LNISSGNLNPMKNSLPLLFLFFGVVIAEAQTTTVLQNNPPSLKWFQVNTPHFRVLFPKGFDTQALRVANNMEHFREEESKSLGKPPRKISVILQSQSAISNGFVTILPRRTEFYGMPPQNYNFLGTNDWLNLVSSHEFRHIVQYQHATRGLNRLLYYLFGSATLAGMAQAAAPMWFWEGDAVATETAFTPSGRGRIPNFGLVFRTNLLEGREFNYHKQYLRSYKHNIPDHYVLGYYMVSYLRKRTNDPNIWGKITARSWNFPIIPFAFSNAIKRETGMHVTTLYREMAKDFRQQWERELNQLELTPFDHVNHRRSTAYTDYLYPQVLGDGSVLAMKRGIGDIEKFVVLKEGEENVYTPGFINDTGMLSAAGDKIIWNEYGYDPRFLVKNYSLVKLYDVSKKQRRVISKIHERMAGAALSPDGTKVVTVRTNTQYQTNIMVLDVATGAITDELPNPENYFYAMPRWSDDGSKIAVVKTTPEGKTISVIDYASKTISDLFAPVNENFGYPVLYKEYLFYNSPATGIDNIFAMRLSSGEKLQVTSSRYGAYNPVVTQDGSTIYYNEQSKNGMDVVKIPFAPSNWKPFTPKAHVVNFYEHLVEQEGDSNVFKNVPQQTLTIKKYSRASGLIHPYTWGANVESNLTQASIGISSKDILSTMEVNAGYIYDINERTGAYGAKASYQGWYPIIDLSASIADRSVDEGDVKYLKKVGQDTVVRTQDLTFKWKETTVEGGLRLPLITTSSRFAGSVTAYNYVGYTHVTNFTNSIDGNGRVITPELPVYFYRTYADHGNLLYNHFGFSAYRLLKQSRRDINSKWGQQLIMESFATPFGGDYSGNQFSTYGILYFPGLFKHHSLWGYGSYQHVQITAANPYTGEGMDNYIFRNRIPVPRGQSVARFQDFYGMSVNYTFPVWYPDVAIGPLLNIQRLRANFFYDYGHGQSPTFKVSGNYASTGVEARLDINIMRFLPQFDIGVRYTKGLTPAVSKFEVLIGTFHF
jgi:hypothetical protein